MSQKLSRRAARANAFKAAFASTFGLNEEGARWEIPFDLEDCELDDFARSLLEQLSLHKDEIDEVKKVLEEEMVHACELKVPLIAEVKQGNNWYEAK